MKYFAVYINDHNAVNCIINESGYPNPIYYRLQFAVLYENTLQDEDYTAIRLKFVTQNPTRLQLEVAMQLNKITLNLDEYPEEI